MFMVLMVRLPSILLPAQRESLSDGEVGEGEEEEVRGATRKTSKAFRTIKIFNS